MSEATEGNGGPAVADQDVNKHPTIKEALARISDAEDLPDIQIFKLDVRTLANGEVTCRWLAVGEIEDEWEGFVLPPAS